jgi:Bacterial membrane protein YfhO
LPFISVNNHLSAWLKPSRFAIVLAALIVAFFPDTLLGGKAFMFRDFGIFTYPNAFFQRISFWRGEFPLWNPLNNCGIPFLAQWNTVCLYPLSLVYILLPLTWGLVLFLLAHLFLAGFGMYLLASQWTGNRLAAAVAGIAFTFNGLTLNCLMWSSNLAALAWMPCVILLVERAFLSGKRRPILIAALAGAFQMLSGAPEIIIFTWLVLFALWTGQMIGGRQARLKLFARVIIILTITTLLSAAQLLPFLDLLAHSERTSSYGTSIWSIPLWGWANLLVPLFHCYQAPLGVYFQPGQDWTSSYYLGGGVLALGLLAVILTRSLRVWLLAAFAVFGFAVALGDGGAVYPLLLKLFPPLGFMRYPIKFVFLTVFNVPLLAAFAVAWLQNCNPNQLTRARRWTAGILILFSSTIVGILAYARVRPFPTEHWLQLCENGIARIIFLALILGVVMSCGKIKNPRLQILAGLSLLAFVWLDAVTHAPRQNPTVEASVFAPGLLTQRIKPASQPGEARALMTSQSHELFYGSMLTDAYQDYIGRRCALLGDCNILDNIPVADGFYSLYVGEQRGLFMQFFHSPTNTFPNGLADFLGISKMSDPEHVLAWQSRPSYLPFYSIGAKPEFVELSKTPARLLAQDFNPRKTVFLPPEAKAWLNITNEAQGTIRRMDFAAQRMELEVAASAPALLVLSQTYYHPWRAYVNGQPAKIFRANYAFQAVAIPQGPSTVKLVYQDRAFIYGATISIATLLGCLITLRPKRSIMPS